MRLAQPARGYRVAIDPVLLAAAVPAGAGDVVLDAGAGVGAAALCLAARVEGARITGVEADADLVDVARANAVANGVADRVAFVAGDATRPNDALAPGSVDHIMTNPPFLERGTGRPSTDAAKAAATVEGAGDLAAWIAAGAGIVRPGGTLTLVHRADRLDAVLAALAPAFGGIVVFPLWPGAGKAAKRVLVAGRRGSRAPLRLASGLVLHADGGGYTKAADAVLRDGAAIDLDA